MIDVIEIAHYSRLSLTNTDLYYLEDNSFSIYASRISN